MVDEGSEILGTRRCQLDGISAAPAGLDYVSDLCHRCADGERLVQAVVDLVWEHSVRHLLTRDMHADSCTIEVEKAAHHPVRRNFALVVALQLRGCPLSKSRAGSLTPEGYAFAEQFRKISPRVERATLDVGKEIVARAWSHYPSIALASVRAVDT